MRNEFPYELIGVLMICSGVWIFLMVTARRNTWKKFVTVRMIYDAMGEEGATIFYYFASVAAVVIGILLFAGVIH